MRFIGIGRDRHPEPHTLHVEIGVHADQRTAHMIGCGFALDDPMTNVEPEADQPWRRAVTRTTLVAVAILLVGCNDAHPLYGPDTPRDGAGRPVDPIYGTPLPGTSRGGGGA